MNIYKLRIDDSRWRLITKEDFEFATSRDEPYYQKNKLGEDMHYAVCPECDNPIQIIGLYKELKHTSHPYAKHCNESVEGFPYFNPEDIEHCSLSRRGNRSLSKNSLREFDRKAQQILKLLIEHFDQVAYMFGIFSGIRMTKGLAQSMLEKYGSDGCLYRGASPMNVPWTFAYMADFQKLYGRIIECSDLREAILQNWPEVYFEGKQLKTRKYLEIGFHFTSHRQNCNPEGGLKESFEMVISANEKKFVWKRIEFDHEHFRGLTFAADDKRPNKAEYLALAKEALPNVEPL